MRKFRFCVFIMLFVFIISSCSDDASVQERQDDGDSVEESVENTYLDANLSQDYGEEFESDQEFNTDYSVGDYVYLGQYEQDGNALNEKEDIQWKIIDIQGNKALLLSRYVLEEIRYNE